MSATPSTPPPLMLACLCAAWCRLCDGYAETLRAVAAEFPQVQLHWIDIEDEAELVGDLDIETFPTLVLARDTEVLFAGALEPQPQTLRRLITGAIKGRVVGGDVAEYTALVQALAKRTRESSAVARWPARVIGD